MQEGSSDRKYAAVVSQQPDVTPPGEGGMGRVWLKLTGKRCRYVKAGACNLHTVPQRPGVIVQMNAAAFL